MLVSVFSNQVLTAAVGQPVATKSRVIEVGSYNYANATLNIRDIVTLEGTPSVSLVVEAEGSIDGQNWATIGNFGFSESTEGVFSSESSLLYPWLRFDVVFSVTGSAGDKAEVVFCLQATLRRR